MICSVLEFEVLDRFTSVGDAFELRTRLFPVTVKVSILGLVIFRQIELNGTAAAAAA